MLAESDGDQTRARAIRSGLLVHKVQTASALGWTATEVEIYNSMTTRFEGSRTTTQDFKEQ